MNGVGAFNKEASNAYKNIDELDKERLLNVAGGSSSDHMMTTSDIKKAGAKIFKKLQNLVCNTQLYQQIFWILR